MKEKVVVLGAAGTGVGIAESIERSPLLELMGFLDDRNASEECDGSPILGKRKDWQALPDDYNYINSLYGPKRNKSFFKMIESLAIPDRRPSVIHMQLCPREQPLELVLMLGPVWLFNHFVSLAAFAV
jgi:hypothetical protein